MDRLAPDLLWVGGCCYRLPVLKDDEKEPRSSKSLEDTETYNEDLQPCTDEPCDMEFDVEVLESGRFRLQLPIPKVFWPKLVGAKGSAKRRVEEETRTSVTIPRPNHDGDVIIIGDTRRDVNLARLHIEESVRAARQRLPYTHFLSIPAQSGEIHANFQTFKMKAQSLSPSLPDELFSPPEKLHLTLTMLLLTDDNERKQACDMFQQLSSVLSAKMAGKELNVDIKGLNTFNDDLSKTTVVYAKAEHHLLQELADEAAAFYHPTGFVKERDIQPKVKLHVTLLNSRFLKKEEENEEAPPRRGGQYARKPSISFDARPFWEDLKDFCFGSVNIKTIHLSQMGNRGEDGYYVSSATMQF